MKDKLASSRDDEVHSSGDKTADLAHVGNDAAKQVREIRKQHRTAMNEIMLKHKLSKVQVSAVNRWQDNIFAHSKVMVSASQLRAQKKNLHHVHVHHHVQLYADHVKMLNEIRGKHGLTPVAMKSIEKAHEQSLRVFADIQTGMQRSKLKHLGEGHADEMQEIRRNHRAVMQQVLLAHKLSPVQEKELMAYHDGHIASLEKRLQESKVGGVTAESLQGGRQELRHVHLAGQLTALRKIHRDLMREVEQQYDVSRSVLNLVHDAQDKHHAYLEELAGEGAEQRHSEDRLQSFEKVRLLHKQAMEEIRQTHKVNSDTMNAISNAHEAIYHGAAVIIHKQNVGNGGEGGGRSDRSLSRGGFAGPMDIPPAPSTPFGLAIDEQNIPDSVNEDAIDDETDGETTKGNSALYTLPWQILLTPLKKEESIKKRQQLGKDAAPTPTTPSSTTTSKPHSGQLSDASSSNPGKAMSKLGQGHGSLLKELIVKAQS